MIDLKSLKLIARSIIKILGDVLLISVAMTRSLINVYIRIFVAVVRRQTLTFRISLFNMNEKKKLKIKLLKFIFIGLRAFV